jgi:hypothetical protein
MIEYCVKGQGPMLQAYVKAIEGLHALFYLKKEMMMAVRGIMGKFVEDSEFRPLIRRCAAKMKAAFEFAKQSDQPVHELRLYVLCDDFARRLEIMVQNEIPESLAEVVIRFWRRIAGKIRPAKFLMSSDFVPQELRDSGYLDMIPKYKVYEEGNRKWIIFNGSWNAVHKDGNEHYLL